LWFEIVEIISTAEEPSPVLEAVEVIKESGGDGGE